jgi:hypothetical protein
MNQSSEEFVPQTAEAPPTARIIPFERPQSELQRAVQQRAQECIEAEGKPQKVSKTRRLVTFAVALIPVAIIFTGFLFAVHAVRVITSLYSNLPTANEPAPAAPEAPQPGVVILVPHSAVPPNAPQPQPQVPAP